MECVMEPHTLKSPSPQQQLVHLELLLHVLVVVLVDASM
jgi:hypothetical protein